MLYPLGELLFTQADKGVIPGRCIGLAVIAICITVVILGFKVYEEDKVIQVFTGEYQAVEDWSGGVVGEVPVYEDVVVEAANNPTWLKVMHWLAYPAAPIAGILTLGLIIEIREERKRFRENAEQRRRDIDTQDDRWREVAARWQRTGCVETTDVDSEVSEAELEQADEDLKAWHMQILTDLESRSHLSKSEREVLRDLQRQYGRGQTSQLAPLQSDPDF